MVNDPPTVFVRRHRGTTRPSTPQQRGRPLKVANRISADMALGAIDDAMECLSGAVSSVVAAPSVSV